MHAKTDSEATSLSASSPRRAAYYVQSPSRESHDGEKTATSFHSTPTASPPHSHSSVGHHSRESSSTRFSGSLKPGSGKITPASANRKPGQKHIDVIDEEGGGYYDDVSESRKPLPRRCYCLIFILGFLILFSLFSLILWGASRSQKPNIILKSIKMETFVIQAGSDNTGVATDMVTMNSTVKLTFRNTATFFGVHVVSTPVDLSYSQIALASGAIKKFYQSRKSQRTVTILMSGNRIPLYGSGASLSSINGVPTVPVPLKLNMVMKSKAYVLGKLVKPNFNKKIECSVVYDPKKHNAPISLKNSCKYN